SRTPIPSARSALSAWRTRPVSTRRRRSAAPSRSSPSSRSLRAREGHQQTFSARTARSPAPWRGPAPVTATGCKLTVGRTEVNTREATPGWRTAWGPLGLGGVALGLGGAVAAGEAAAVLRCCCGPDKLPVSNGKSEGYENKIAEVIAQDLGM